MNTLCKFLLCPWILCTALCIPSAGQASGNDAPTPTFRVSSRLVVLDVVVTDAAGKPVPGLQRDDFTLFEDGKSQTIHDFESWSDRPAAPAKTNARQQGARAWSPGTPQTILLLDELNTPFDEKSFCAENMKRYLLAQPATLTSPTTLITVNYTGLSMLADYTQDRDALVHALEKRPGALPAPITGLDLAAQSFAMLRQIAMAAAGEHTHINLIWVGRGFPAMDPTDFTAPDALVLKKAIEDTVNLLIAARITIYQINPITVDDRMATADMDAAMASGAGLSSSLASTASIDMLDQQFGFNTFVASTGGRLYYGSNDLARFISDSAIAGSDFYTLTYVPPPDFGGKSFHTIRVVPRDPALRVSTRNGLYASDTAPVETNLKDLGFDLKLAATSAMRYPNVGVQLIAATRRKSTLSLRFSVDDRSLQWIQRMDGSDGTKILVLLVSLDQSNNIATSTAKTLNVAVKDPADIASGHLDTTQEVPLNSRSRRIRLIVRDADGKIGTADLDTATLASLPGR